MKRMILAQALVGLALAAWAAATATGADRPGGWSEGLFAERQHDFGPVPRGAKVRHPFVLTNTTAGPVSILNLRVSCGCTSGKANVAAVPPGGTGVVEAEMDTRNFVGNKATTLFVTLHNGAEEVEVGLGVRSNILSDIVLNPGGIDFGTIARGQSPTASLTIDRIGQPEWRVVKMVSASKVLGAALAETQRANGMVSYRLDVSIKPGVPAGTVRDEIELLTNDPESRSFPVLVTAEVKGDLSASPSVLALGAPTSSEPVQGRFIVRSSKPFKVVKIEGAGDGFTASADDGVAKPIHVVTVAYRTDAGKPAGPARTFKIVTDLPGEAPASVTATLQGPN
ncbi:MAG TPA: DUF1573 domain-containing protein [Isosphaeraceae bacterium]|jgi:hypothetical protein